MTVKQPFQLSRQASRQLSSARASAASFGDDVAEGFFEITHNSFALLGLIVAFACVALVAKPDLRQTGETYLMTWLQERQPQDLSAELEEPEFVELTAVERATAANPKELPTQQAALAYWLSRKYGVAPEPLSVLVSQAFEIGLKAKLDPTLILAVMAVESRFNPFAQSPVSRTQDPSISKDRRHPAVTVTTAEDAGMSTICEEWSSFCGSSQNRDICDYVVNSARQISPLSNLIEIILESDSRRF